MKLHRKSKRSWGGGVFVPANGFHEGPRHYFDIDSYQYAAIYGYRSDRRSPGRIMDAGNPIDEGRSHRRRRARNIHRSSISPSELAATAAQSQTSVSNTVCRFHPRARQVSLFKLAAHQRAKPVNTE